MLELGTSVYGLDDSIMELTMTQAWASIATRLSASAIQDCPSFLPLSHEHNLMTNKFEALQMAHQLHASQAGKGSGKPKRKSDDANASEDEDKADSADKGKNRKGQSDHKKAKASKEDPSFKEKNANKLLRDGSKFLDNISKSNKGLNSPVPHSTQPPGLLDTAEGRKDWLKCSNYFKNLAGDKCPLDDKCPRLHVCPVCFHQHLKKYEDCLHVRGASAECSK